MSVSQASRGTEYENEREGWTRGRTFSQNFPLAGFGSLVRWDLRSKVLEEILHLTSPFTFCHFMAYSESRSPTVWCHTIRGHFRIVIEARNLILL